MPSLLPRTFVYPQLDAFCLLNNIGSAQSVIFGMVKLFVLLMAVKTVGACGARRLPVLGAQMPTTTLLAAIRDHHLSISILDIEGGILGLGFREVLGQRVAVA